MKTAVTNGDGSISLAEVPMPEPGPYQCLCKMLACAKCSGIWRTRLNGEGEIFLNGRGYDLHDQRDFDVAVNVSSSSMLKRPGQSGLMGRS